MFTWHCLISTCGFRSLPQNVLSCQESPVEKFTILKGGSLHGSGKRPDVLTGNQSTQKRKYFFSPKGRWEEIGKQKGLACHKIFAVKYSQNSKYPVIGNLSPCFQAIHWWLRGDQQRMLFLNLQFKLVDKCTNLPYSCLLFGNWIQERVT